MSKVRLTREQSRDQTRQRLLDAAQSIFITKGFVAASVEDIAEQAGYTRGAFYSNFGSKSELLLQLLRRDHEHVMAEMRAIFEQEGLARADGRKRAAPLQHPLPRERLFPAVDGSQAAGGARSAVLRRLQRLSARAARSRRRIRAAVFRACGHAAAHGAGKLAVGLLALSDGMQFSYAFDPQTITDEVTEAVLAAFFRRIVFGEPTPE